MKLGVATMVLLVACGKGGETKATSGSAKPAAQPSAPAGPPPPDKPGVVGSLEVAGAVTGTFSHPPDTTMTCASIPDLPQATFDITMSDGKDSWISLQGVSAKDKHTLQLTSAKIGTTAITATEGFTISGDASDHVTAVIDTTATAEGKTVSIKGRLAFTCAPL